MSTPRRIGIIGFGAFGRFMARHLAPHFELVAADRRDLRAEAAALGIGWGTVADAAACDALVLAVPVPALASVVEQVRDALRPGALVIDVCSVKVRPFEILEAGLPPEVDILGTHPMFGPQSGRDGIVGLKVVACPHRTQRLPEVRRFLERTLGLEVLEMTPERHDRQMAYIQGLTHWMAKALREITLPDLELATVAYRHMLQIEEILRDDSDELFLTIERDNPFAAEARRELIDRLAALEEWIGSEPKDDPGSLFRG